MREFAVYDSWAAGLFEGEGCVRINKATKRNLGHLVCSVTNTDQDLLKPFLIRWGGCVKVASTGPGRKRAWVWHIAARKAAAFLRDIRHFCYSETKLTKIALGLEFQDQKSRTNWVSDEYRRRQVEYYELMKTLNIRGVKQ